MISKKQVWGMLALGLVLVGCPNGTDDDPQVASFISSDSVNKYTLTITENVNRAAYTAVAGDSYELKVELLFNSSIKISRGIIQSIDNARLNLRPTNSAEIFNIDISSGQMTYIVGKITYDDNTNETISGNTLLPGEYVFPRSINLSFDIPAYEDVEITKDEWDEARSDTGPDDNNDYFEGNDGNWKQFYDYEGGYAYAYLGGGRGYHRVTYWEPSDAQFNEIIEKLNLPDDWEILGDKFADLRIHGKAIRPSGVLSNGEYWILASNPMDTLYKDSTDEIVESLSWKKIIID